MVPTRRAFLGAVTVTIGLAGCLGDESSGGTTDTATPTPPSTDTASATDAPEPAATVRVASHSEYGEILVDAAGSTLYLFEQDENGAGSSSCNDGCAEAWPPLTVSGEPTASDGVTAEITTFQRGSGGTQVAAGGWPLYYYASDGGPGDATGQGVGDVWWVVAPDGTAVKADGGGATATPTSTETSGEGPY